MKTSESGVDQLIQRVKSEAIEKAQSERKEIINQANKEAHALIEEAKKQATALLRETQTIVNNEKRKLATELNLAARDFSIKLNERLKTQMFFPVIKKNVRATLNDPNFLKDVMTQLVDGYLTKNPGSIDVLVTKELKTTLAAFFAGSIFDNLDENSEITLKNDDGLDGFVLVKRGEHFVWDFRVETIAEEIMRLVEPSLRKYFLAKPNAVQADNAEHARA